MMFGVMMKRDSASSARNVCRVIMNMFQHVQLKYGKWLRLGAFSASIHMFSGNTKFPSNQNR